MCSRSMCAAMNVSLQAFSAGEAKAMRKARSALAIWARSFATSDTFHSATQPRAHRGIRPRVPFGQPLFAVRDQILAQSSLYKSIA